MDNVAFHSCDWFCRDHCHRLLSQEVSEHSDGYSFFLDLTDVSNPKNGQEYHLFAGRRSKAYGNQTVLCYRPLPHISYVGVEFVSRDPHALHACTDTYTPRRYGFAGTGGPGKPYDDCVWTLVCYNLSTEVHGAQAGRGSCMDGHVLVNIAGWHTYAHIQGHYMRSIPALAD